MGIPNEETSAAPGEGSSPRTILILSALIVIAGALVHVGSLEGVFLFDDQSGIVENETIRSLSNPSRVLSPPHDTTVAGRPLVNLTLALNHAAGGLSVRGYHIVNLAVHLLAACALFSVTRRTLLRISSLSSSATSLAFATALLWVVHPLTTAPVSYIIQRAESLAALFSLWTLYCVARSEASKRKTLWWIAAIAACFCGVLTKEVAAVIPVLVIAWHWSFCRGTIRQILQRNALLYAGLVATWVPLAWVALGVRSRSVGFEFSEYSSWGYLKVQAGAVLHYLRLCLWPRPLAFDYGWPEIPAWTAAAGPGLVVLVLVVGSTLGLVRRHPLGFAGTAFFAVLAPTSSFIPVVTEVIAEHRVYLPLAAVIASVVGLGATAMSRRGIRPAGSVGLLLLAVAAAALATRRPSQPSRERAGPLHPRPGPGSRGQSGPRVRALPRCRATPAPIREGAQQPGRHPRVPRAERGSPAPLWRGHSPQTSPRAPPSQPGGLARPPRRRRRRGPPSRASGRA
jgi:hypothetical protein